MKLFTNSHISSFCMSLHLALQAGISIAEGVEMYSEEESDKYRQERINIVAGELIVGEQLSLSLRKCEAFPEYMVDMIEVGEKTGKLDETLLSLSHYYDRQETIAKSIRGATTYPIMLLCVLLLVLVVFVVRILPIFYDVYKQLGAEMSGIATAALNFGNWLSTYWIIIVSVIAVIVILAIVLRKQFKALMRKLFMGGKLGASMQGARFASILSMTLTSGMDPDEALTMAARLTDEENVREKIAAAQSRRRRVQVLRSALPTRGFSRCFITVCWLSASAPAAPILLWMKSQTERARKRTTGLKCSSVKLSLRLLS